jgi:hypothetical protein
MKTAILAIKIKHALRVMIAAYAFVFLSFMSTSSYAGSPLWTMTPLTPTTVSVAANTSVTILYRVSNQSSRSHTLSMTTIPGVVQVTYGRGVCSNPFTLSGKGSSCVLSLQVNGSQLNRSIYDGPVVCEQGSGIQCYRPSASAILQLSLAPAISLPAGCTDTGNNNIQCQTNNSGQINYGFTNMTYALCRSAQCPYDGVQSTVTCNCLLISANQGLYSASVAPSDYNTSKPSGNTVTSTYSQVNSSGESPTACPSGAFANCFGATCIVNGSSVTCTCPVVVAPFIAVNSTCNLGSNLIWSATSTTSFSAIESTMLFMYNNFFGGNTPQ